jgi:hypothetical protein
MRTRTLALLVATLMASAAAFGGDAEFDRIVRAIESHYGTRPRQIPFLGVANLLLKVARPEGAAGFKLAVFDGMKDLKSVDAREEWRERDRFMDTLPNSNLHPLVRVHSRHNAEATYIFMGEEGRSSRVLIATFERDRATVVEVKANIRKLFQSLREPQHARQELEDDAM